MAGERPRADDLERLEPRFDRAPVDEPVADAPHVDHEAVAELAPQPAGVGVERARRARRAEAPDVAQQLVLGVARASARSARWRSSANSLLRQRDRRPPSADLARGRVDHQRAHPQAARAAALARAAQQRGHARRAAPSRRTALATKSSRAALEAAHAVDLARAAGEDDERQLAGPGATATPSPARTRRMSVEPRAVGQPEVDDREVRRAVLERAQRVAQRLGHARSS